MEGSSAIVLSIHSKISRGSNTRTRQKQQYDSTHNTNTTIKVGNEDLVQSMNNIGRKGGKLEPLFASGPYEVAEDLGKGRF